MQGSRTLGIQPMVVKNKGCVRYEDWNATLQKKKKKKLHKEEERDTHKKEDSLSLQGANIFVIKLQYLNALNNL
jgi:predicted N-acyltransferase